MSNIKGMTNMTTEPDIFTIENRDAIMLDLADMIEHIITAASAEKAPENLEDLARKSGYPAATFQKLFTRYVGLSPNKFRRYLDMQRAEDFMTQGYGTLEAAHAAGLSGNGRLHDLCLEMNASTPGQLKNRGKNLHIQHGKIPTPLGYLCVGISECGLCWAGFLTDNKNEAASISAMKKFWKNAEFSKASEKTLNLYQRPLYDLWSADFAPEANAMSARDRLQKNPLKIYLEGSNFQIRVWQALLKIPCGASTYYGAIGDFLGQENASRAVGGAVGANPISWIIPCHRVLQKSGIVHNYAWGNTRKKSLLAMEGAASHAPHNRGKPQNND